MSLVETLRVVQAPSERKRNAGVPLDLSWVKQVHVNRSALQRRASTLTCRRAVENEWRAAWLLHAIGCVDLTSLAGDDSSRKVRSLCAKARHPVRDDLLSAMDASGLAISAGAVCVFPAGVADAVTALEGSRIPVAAFSSDLSPLKLSLAEIDYAVEAGVSEIEVAIAGDRVVRGDWEVFYAEIAAFREASRGACLKVMLAADGFASPCNVQKASLTAMMAGSDFIGASKTKEAANTSFEIGLAVVRAIREYQQRTGYRVGFKAAGGIRHARQALEWLVLSKEELGREWLEPELLRIGASSLLNDIERELEYHVTGRYSPSYRYLIAEEP
jgi:deoxyribose-phosphate aldolase